MKMIRSNLTLLELVISLAIIAALASVLLDNFADMEIRERERQTLYRGEMVRDAMSGCHEKDGISRFLSDMGRWPKVTVETDSSGNRLNERNLAQFYDRTVFYHNSETETMFSHNADNTLNQTVLGLPAAPVFTRYSFPKISMRVGWNGPYLNLLSTDGAKFTDGWGKPWKIITNFYFEKTGSALTPKYDAFVENPASTVEIEGIASLGADAVSGGTDAADKDHEFIFAHDLCRASLTVTLKVRDDFDPAVWNDLSLVNASEYSAGTYARGRVVYIQNSGVKYYYTSLVNGNILAPNQNTTDYTAVNDGWLYGTPSNTVSLDSVKVLLFAPAKRTVSGGTSMETGFYRFIPNISTETDKTKRFPPLHYCHEISSGAQTICTDAEATSDTNLDENVALGEQNKNRLRTKLTWNATSAAVSSSFRIDWLVPGYRRIYAFAAHYNDSPSGYTSMAASSVEWVYLKPGENYITLYLEQKQ